MRKQRKDKTRRQIATHNRNLSNAAMGKFCQMLEYKCGWTDTELTKIGQFQASTTVCHKCGYKLGHSLETKYRSWTCPNCNSELDRDLNAAKVIDLIAENMLPECN